MAELHSTLPPSWTVKTLEEVCELITDGTHQTPIYSNKGYIFLSARNVTSGKINWENIKYIPQELHDKLYNRLAPQLNDILLAKNGTTGVAAIVDKECVFDIYVSLALLRPKQNTIFPLYLLYSLQDVKVQEQFRGKLIGMGVPNLHLRDIRTTTIPIPPLKEQKEIVKILDSAFEQLDHSLENCKQALTLTKELWQSSLDKALSHREGWATSSLSDVCDTGAGGTPLKSQIQFYENGNIPWLLSGEVNQKHITSSKNFITELGLQNSSAKMFPNNSVLVAMYGATAGQVGILKFSCSTNQAVCAILPSNKLIPEFIYYYLLLFKPKLVSQAVGGAQPNISQEKIRKIEFPVPPLEEQKKIVAKLDKINDFIKKLEYDYTNKILYIKELKSSLLNDAFTGKLTNKE